MLATLAGWWIARLRGAIPPATGDSARLRSAAGVLLAGGSFFFAYIFLISLLSFPFGRYFAGAALLLPGSLCGAVVCLWLEVAQRSAQRSITASTSVSRIGGAEA